MQLLTIIVFLVPLNLLNASEMDIYPEVRAGLFLHSCDVIHRHGDYDSRWWAFMLDSPYKNRPDAHVVSSLAAEFELYLPGGQLEEELINVARLCVDVYDTKVKIKQAEYDWFTWFSNLLPNSAANERGSVFALTTKDGSQFILTHADRLAHQIFCEQSYDQQKLMDRVWPDTYKILQTLEPELLAAWETYFTTTNSP